MIGRITDSMKSIILFVILCCSVEFSYAQMSLTNPFGINLSRPTKSSSQLTFDTQNIRIPQVISQDDSPILNLKPYTKELEKVAKRGDASSQAEVGKCYLFGSGVGVDYKKAQKWFEQAIEQNNADAIFWMGYMYENKLAKKIKLASGWDKHFMYDHGASVKDDEEKAYREAPQKYYEQAASLGQPDALYKLYRKNKDLTNLRSAAEKGNMKAQYDLGAYFLNQFSSSKNDETNLSLAKEWFTKAAENGHPDAAKCVSGIEDTERQIEVAKREAEERARKEAVEAARRDSIAAVELARQMAEAEQQRKQDSIDIAAGRKQPSFQYLIKDVTLYKLDNDVDNAWQAPGNGSHAVSDAMGATIRSLCKSGSKSSQKYAALIRINAGFKWSEITYQQNSFKFSNIYSNSSSLKQPFKDYFVLLGDILFPIKQGISTHTDTDLRWREIIPIESSDLLSEIRINEQNICLLLIFKPSFWRKEVLSYMEGYDTDLYFVDPVGLYLVNPSQNKVLLNLSHYTRRANISEKQKFTNYFKAESQRKQRRGNQNGIVTRQRCSNCRGTGVYVWPSGNRVTCWACDGRGYIEYRY